MMNTYIRPAISDKIIENIRYKTYPVSNTTASLYDETIYNPSQPYLDREIDLWFAKFCIWSPMI